MAQSEEYAAARMVSQSALKVLENDPKKFYWEEERFLNGELTVRPGRSKTDYMLMGDITETLLFDPTNFKKQYKVVSDAPTGQMLDFVNEYYRMEVEGKPSTKEEVQNLAEMAYVYAGFKRDKIEKVLERFKTEALSYYNDLKSGKTLVTSEMKAKADSIVANLKADEFIGSIVNAKTEGSIEVADQLEIYSTFYTGEGEFMEVKGALDRVIVDHLEKKIYPYDFKTTSDFFLSSFVSYRYDIQAAFYLDLVYKWKNITEPRLKNYFIQPFTFIAASTVVNRNELWVATDNDIAVGTFGGENKYGRKVKGFSQLMQELKWHRQHNKWNYPKEVYENNGRKILNCYKQDE